MLLLLPPPLTFRHFFFFLSFRRRRHAAAAAEAAAIFMSFRFHGRHTFAASFHCHCWLSLPLFSPLSDFAASVYFD
jgi:hypothetical protein